MLPYVDFGSSLQICKLNIKTVQALIKIIPTQFYFGHSITLYINNMQQSNKVFKILI